MYTAVGALPTQTENAIKKFVASHCFSPEFDRCINADAGKPGCEKYQFINDAYAKDEAATEALIMQRADCDYTMRQAMIFGGIAVAGAALAGFLVGLRI